MSELDKGKCKRQVLDGTTDQNRQKDPPTFFKSFKFASLINSDDR